MTIVTIVYVLLDFLAYAASGIGGLLVVLGVALIADVLQRGGRR